MLGGLLLLLGKHHHLIDEVGDPLLAEAEPCVVFAYADDGFHHSGFGEVVFGEDVIDGLLCRSTYYLLEERRYAELELHQVARQHHHFLG